MPKHRMQLELAMSHLFFEWITLTRGTMHIRQREHKPAPILCHLADRPSYVMQSIMDTEVNHGTIHVDPEREGSIIDTTLRIKTNKCKGMESIPRVIMNPKLTLFNCLVYCVLCCVVTLI
eukprot:25718_1